MTSPYRRGYLIELKCMDKLKEMGAEIVIRSSRSRGPIDIIAIFPKQGLIYLIQVKGYGALPRTEKGIKKRFKELSDLKGIYQVIPKVYGKKEGKYQFIEI